MAEHFQRIVAHRLDRGALPDFRPALERARSDVGFDPDRFLLDSRLPGGNAALELRRLLRRVGNSEIFARYLDPGLVGEVLALDTYAATASARRGRNLLVYHASIGEPEVTDFLLQRPERLVLVYHNITPPAPVAAYDPPLARLLALGPVELSSLRERVALALAVSAYNARGLEALGYEGVRVCPMPVDVSSAQVRRANGGIPYRGFAEFEAAVDTLLERPTLATALGESGQRFVENRYQWAAVIDRYGSLLRATSGRSKARRDPRPEAIYFALVDIKVVGAMARTLLDLDDDALARAAAVLGTTSKVETVNRALRLVAASAEPVRGREEFDELLDLLGDRLAGTDVRSEAWR